MLSYEELARGNLRRRSITIAAAIVTLEAWMKQSDDATAAAKSAKEREHHMREAEIFCAAADVLRWSLGEDTARSEVVARALGEDCDGL